MTDYEPRGKEIRAEMWNDLKGKLGCVKDCAKDLKDFGVLAAQMSIGLTIAPYLMPSLIRTGKEVSRDIEAGRRKKREFTIAEDCGAFTGLVAALAVNVGQVYLYSSLANNEHPEVLAIPVATNVVSGMYELVRSSYKNAYSRLTEQNKSAQQLDIGALVDRETAK